MTGMHAWRPNRNFAVGFAIATRQMILSLPAHLAIFALRLTATTNGYDPDLWEERAQRRARESLELDLAEAARRELKQLRREIAMREGRR